MIVPSKIPVCQRTKPDGHRCGSPALKGKRFCYYHYGLPLARIRPIADLTDAASLQTAIADVLDGLRNRTIEKQQAHLVLYALYLAMQNLPDCQKGDSA